MRSHDDAPAPQRQPFTFAGLVVVFALAGCGASEKATSGHPDAANTTRAADSAVPMTPVAVLNAFRDARLEVGRYSTMHPEDYGIAPVVAKQGIRFLIPSLGKDAGGRVFSFANVTNLHKIRDAYERVSRSSGLLHSWVFANEHRLVLVQINGDLSRSRAREYHKVVEGLGRAG